MAYDEGLERRIRELLAELPDLVAKKMFGGVGFMVRGNMACGVNGDNLIVRVGPERYESALEEPHTRVFDMTGRPMKGWVTVAPQGLEADEVLAYWVRRGVEFALTLPAK
jgi:TfoX/Sxy family transcriptional regulator of competence genes